MFLLLLSALALAQPDWAVAEVDAGAGYEDRDHHLALLIEQNQAGLAEETGRRWVAAAPLDASSWILLARTLHREPDRAEALYRVALRLDPNSARARVGLGQIRHINGQPAYALDMLEQALKLDDGLLEGWLALASSHRATGNHNAAASATQEAIDRFPSRPEGYELAAALSPAKAIEILSRGVAAVPDSPDLRAALASALLKAGRVASARASLDAGKALDPRHAEIARLRPYVACLLSAVLDADGYADLELARTATFRPLGAKTSGDALVRDYPGCGMSWIARAAERRIAGDIHGALADLSEAADRMPEDPNAAIPYGLALLNAGKPSEARRWLQTASRTRPWDSSLVLREAEAALAEGKPSEARGLLEAAWRRTQHNARIAVALSELIDDRGEAFELLIRAVTEIPYDEELVERTRVVAISLDREQELDNILEPRISLRRMQVPNSEPEITADEEITVFGKSESDRLRELLDEELQQYGYGAGVVGDDRTRYPARNGHPALTVYHDGRLDIQKSGFIPRPVDVDVKTGIEVSGTIPFLNKRKMAPRRQAVLEVMKPHLSAWRQALGTEKTLERVASTLTDDLDALWYEGTPLSGEDELVSRPQRRAAILDHWATRTCDEIGASVREILRKYLLYEVNASEFPVTGAELAEANEKTACDLTLFLDK